MRILIVTPAPPRSRKGNRITALRWARLLRRQGHRVEIRVAFGDESCDLLVALHARRSAASIQRFHRRFPDRPLVVALTGTDLYADIQRNRAALRSLELADRLILLQPLGVHALPGGQQSKARVIYQSVAPPRRVAEPLSTVFEVTVLGHLRSVKDPFRTALAAGLLPASSRIRIVHLGAALGDAMRRRAEREMCVNPRYRWLGEVPHWQAKQRLARSRLLALTSKLEGGANVVGEALACSVPIVSSRIDGSIGLLGKDYPGYFDVGDTRGLAELLERAEQDRGFYQRLSAQCARQAWVVDPKLEQHSWQELLKELLR